MQIASALFNETDDTRISLSAAELEQHLSEAAAMASVQIASKTGMRNIGEQEFCVIAASVYGTLLGTVTALARANVNVEIRPDVALSTEAYERVFRQAFKKSLPNAPLPELTADILVRDVARGAHLACEMIRRLGSHCAITQAQFNAAALHAAGFIGGDYNEPANSTIEAADPIVRSTLEASYRKLLESNCGEA